MRTTITLDDDVVALIESERAHTGESFRVTVNRLLRRSARVVPSAGRQDLPTLPGRPVLDVTDVSALLSTLDDERRAERGIL
jgi:negative regulator of replication initiation